MPGNKRMKLDTAPSIGSSDTNMLEDNRNS